MIDGWALDFLAAVHGDPGIGQSAGAAAAATTKNGYYGEHVIPVLTILF